MRVDATEESALLKRLLEDAGLTRKTAKARIAAGAVRVNGAVQTNAGAKVQPGDTIEIGKPGPRLGLGLTVLYEDEHLICVDKPAGLLSVASGREKERTAEAAVSTYLGRRTCRVHRLDRDTSGVLLFAKNHEAKQVLERGWQRFEKRYLAVTDGVPEPRKGTIDQPLRETKALDVVIDEQMRGQRDAITHYKTLRIAAGIALVEVDLETGRKHQIRVHLASIDAPIVGDKRYSEAAKRSRSRMLLHASRLRFFFTEGEWMTVESPVPSGFLPQRLRASDRAS